MIENERQYKITRTKIANLESALKQSLESARNLSPELQKAVVAGIQSQIDDLRAEIQEYEQLKAKKISHFSLESLAQLGDALIKARIVRGYTQAQLAQRLNLQPQQIQKYETTRYESASLRRIFDVMFGLEIDIQAEIDLRQKQQSEDFSDKEDAPLAMAAASVQSRSHFITNPSCLKELGIDIEGTRERAQQLRASA